MNELPTWAVRLRDQRQSRDWSLLDMARGLSEAADARTRTHLPTRESLVRMIRSWEAGKHRPSEPYPRLFAEIFAIPEAALFADNPDNPDTPGEDTYPGYPSRETHRLPEGVRSLDISLPTCVDMSDMQRRAAIQLLAAISAGGIIPVGVMETVLSGVEDALRDHADVDTWESVVDEYNHLADKRPVGSLIADLTADVVAVGRLMNRGNPPLVQAGLLRVSAGLGWILASQLEDIGERRAARVTWSTTRRAADASGDRDLMVWVRAKEASMARWSGRPDSVTLALTDEAISLANGHPSRGLARACAVRASLAARRGEMGAQDAYAALNALSDATNRAGSERSVYWAQAYVYVLLGDGRATSAMEAAFDPVSPEHVSELHMLQALDLVRRREVGEGLQQALATVQARPASVARRHMAGQILTALPEKARNLPAAHELRALTA
ncbi:XRE family transcriptional regulator [Sphaerisporangium sp. NPDC051017]|uniref:XRE family transcriptional regulator n=1 Tax=Sphaerisporangium sp. NPDC051017 TaxID=3154636 RepID=UPI00341B5AFE